MTAIKKIFYSGLCWLWLSILVIALDRYSKLWMLDNLSLHESMPILPVFNFTLYYNTGAAFSFLSHAGGWQNIFFTSLACIISVAIIIYLYKLPAKACWLGIALALVLAGALGNAWDRLTYGFVIDFADFHIDGWHFAIFNVADSAVCVAAFMLFWTWVLQPKK